MTDISSFIKFAIDNEVLQFGEFTTKARRLSPYFFNLGNCSDGESLKRLGEYYAQTIQHHQIPFDMIFGPAYKGISLASSIAIALSQKGKNVPFCFNRKEIKDHGEGGKVIGAQIKGKVLIVDDVISAGTSITESVKLISDSGGAPCGIIVAIDRQEKGQSNLSAIQEMEAKYAIPIISIINLDEIKKYLIDNEGLGENLRAIEKYQNQYGVR